MTYLILLFEIDQRIWEMTSDSVQGILCGRKVCISHIQADTNSYYAFML